MLQKGPFVERQSEGRLYPDQLFMRRAANGGREPKITDAASCTNGSYVQIVYFV
jgi:hypothetical protein